LAKGQIEQFWVDPTNPTGSIVGPNGEKQPQPSSCPAGVASNNKCISFTSSTSDTTTTTIVAFDATGLITYYNQLTPKNNTTLQNPVSYIYNFNTPTSPLVAAVLPSSRSVRVGGTPATAFATIINTGTAPASACSIVLDADLPVSLVYQTTDPSTNVVSGTPNTPVMIAPNNGAQSFVIGLTPSAPFAPTDVAFAFGCQTVARAPVVVGLDTLLLSASTTAVPDIVALAATALNDGILHITGNTGSNAFAVATVNVGATASITATADTGAVRLPLVVTLCQTDPRSGNCISGVGPSATTVINANATPTFAIFGMATAAVPFDPANNRIFVRFSDGSGAVRGATSVAVETQ
jgi:hypothetical protein